MPSRYFEDGRQAFGSLVNAEIKMYDGSEMDAISSPQYQNPGAPDLVSDLLVRGPYRVFHIAGQG